MKILIIQENGRHEENRHFRECFCMQRSLQKLEHEVDVWGLGHDSYETQPKYDEYDLILNFENYDASGWTPDLSHTTKPKKFLWSIDAHCRGLAPFISTYNSGKYNLILQSTEDFVQENSTWFPNCYDDSLIKPMNLDKTVDIGFCGSLLNRGGLLDHLSKEHKLQKDIWILGEEMVKKINSYWIHFNINLANDINYRSFETIGCATTLLTNYNPQYEKLGFVDEKNCLFYSDLDDLNSKIEKYVKKYDKLKEINKNAIELAKKHTYDIRAKKLIKLYKDV
tara:strand:- start:783 stop:1625 length:843 start_codon:yes stop_codon:yes gene_type:complete